MSKTEGNRPRVPASLDEWNEAGVGYLPGRLGMEVLAVEPAEVRARMAVCQEIGAWNGFLHAGAVVALADTACGYGTVRSLPDDASGFTTIELKTNFLATALEGTITCTARALHQGRTTQVWDAEVVADSSGKTIAHFRCTQMILRSSAT